MTLSPSPFIFWPRLREQQHLRRYRQHLLLRNVLTRSTPLLAHLDRLLLTVRPAEQAGESQSLARALIRVQRMRLVSPPDPGRTLILRQLCLRWAKDQKLAEQTIPFLVNLQPDGGEPVLVLQECLRGYGFDHDELTLRRGIAAGQISLLIAGWDGLPADQQASWRIWLIATAERYPALVAVVVTGPDTPPWPHFEDWLVDGWDA